MARELVECGEHGEGYAILVCQHLLDGTGVGFFHDQSATDEPWPDAWCAECEHNFQTVPGWTEEPDFPLRFRVVCHHCYEVIRARQLGK